MGDRLLYCDPANLSTHCPMFIKLIYSMEKLCAYLVHKFYKSATKNRNMHPGFGQVAGRTLNSKTGTICFPVFN